MNSVRQFQVHRGKAYQGKERRLNPRIYYPIPIRVRSTENHHERFELDTIADDLSAGGCSARTPREYQPGQKLSLVIRFSLAQNRQVQAATVVARGVVLRSRKRFDGTYSFAVAFRRYRFI